MKSNRRGLLWSFQSSVQGIRWPAVLPGGQAAAVAILHQLEHSQWLAPEELLKQQMLQLDALVRHAWNTVPGYRKDWSDRYDAGVALSYDGFQALPLLSRRALRDGFDALRSTAIPTAHGPTQEGRTSGSTGAPVRFLTTPMVGLYWNVLTLRDHVWHRRDLSQKLAIVREGSTHARADSWGVATMGLVDTGPAVSNSIHTDAAELLEWLLTERPGYLFTYPSLLAELARLALARQARMPELLEVRTVSEALGPELRDLCREAWGVPLVDSYSSSEAGYMALQCPEYEHYHVQSEGVLLEVLDERNRPCGPGEVGRVVVTPLHNFATPLIRYDIGDYAEVGKPCDCGRGLPVLKRVLGRVRNTLVTADGKRYWPLFGTRELTDKLPLLQHQFVQKTVELVEARLVVGRPLSAAEEQMIIARVQSKLPAGMRVELSYVEQLARSASGKFEDFISEVAEASAPSR